MKGKITASQRKELQITLARALKRNTKDLSSELQKIMIDDLVTAFENRISVLMRAQTKRSY